MYVEKRGEDTYRLEITKGRLVNGERNKIKKTVKAKNKKELEEEKARFLIEVEKGEIIKSKNVTLEEFCEEWLEYKKNTETSEETIDRYKSDIDLRIIPFMGKYNLKDITPYIVDKFKEHLSIAKKFSCSNKYKDRTNKPTTDKILSKKSQNEIFKLLRQILEKAVMWEKIGYNPATKIETPKYDRKDIKYYDTENAKRYISELRKEKQPFRVIGFIALYTGERRGEIDGLSWDTVNLKEKWIMINKQVLYSKEKGVYIKYKPKTKKSIRRISICDDLVNELKIYKKWCNNVRKIVNIEHKDMLFFNTKGNLLNPDMITQWNEDFIEKNKLEKITVHGLRHTHATLLANNNVDIPTISARLGHSNTNITGEYYIHNNNEHDVIASQKLEEILG